MKTLIFTSIYSNLWKTEFGGRPSRSFHYRFSLLNILNLKADKFICFTSESEINDLKNFFYVNNNISEDTLQFVSFDLKDTKHFNEIKHLKNMDFIQTSDRCFEVQYNKLFFIDNIPNIEQYDRVFWFDAGLSHSGLFPMKYAVGENYEQYFTFSLFNEQFLNYLNDLSNSKLVVVLKNNTGRFFWSQTLPHEYFENYDNSEYIIGGFFGGTVENFKNLKNIFENLLIRLLQDGDDLYCEEMILSCLYQNNKELFFPLRFDDWYERDFHELSDNIKYFYNIFELNKDNE